VLSGAPADIVKDPQARKYYLGENFRLE